MGESFRQNDFFQGKERGGNMKNSETLVGKFELRPETNVGVDRASFDTRVQ